MDCTLVCTVLFFFKINTKMYCILCRSENREHVLDASNRHAMMYWLQELQKRRRFYNSNQSTKLSRPLGSVKVNTYINYNKET